MQKRVAITGIGVWGCLGKNTEETTAALRAGQSGIGIDEARAAIIAHVPREWTLPKA